MRNFFKVNVRILVDILSVATAFLLYFSTKNVPAPSQHAFVRLFCRTAGRSNDFLTKIIECIYPVKPLERSRGVLSELTVDELDHAANKLNDEGYYIFEEKIPEEICDRLIDFSLKTQAALRPRDGEILNNDMLHYEIYDPGHPKAVCYDFDRAHLISNVDIQNIFSDGSIISLSQKYLNSEPILDAVCMWWQTAFQKNPDKSAAQFYHFDLDRIKWLKFFIYLTDVGTNNGPHTFISGTHKTDGIPKSLLSRGYTRLDDLEVEACYEKKRFIEFNAPRGTIIAEDTRGLHKGKNVLLGHRLILQLQFSNCQFGLGDQSCPKIKFQSIQSPSLVEKVRSNPRVFSPFL